MEACHSSKSLGSSRILTYRKPIVLTWHRLCLKVSSFPKEGGTPRLWVAVLACNRAATSSTTNSLPVTEQATATVTFRRVGSPWAKRTSKLTTQLTQTWTRVRAAVTACTARTLTKAKSSIKIQETWRTFSFSNLSLNQHSRLLTADLGPIVTPRTLTGRSWWWTSTNQSSRATRARQESK